MIRRTDHTILEERKDIIMNHLHNSQFFRRTRQSVLVIMDMEAYKILIIYGTEENVGEEDSSTSQDTIQFDTMEELTLECDKIIEGLLDSGYVETKQQERFPLSANDFYDEGTDEVTIKEVCQNYKIDKDYGEDSNYDYHGNVAQKIKHFSLVAWEEVANIGPDKILAYLIKYKNRFQDMEYFTFGNMNYEVCEMSWIEQSDYLEFFKAYPNIKGFSIQGNTINNKLGIMNLLKLEILELWGSGLMKNTLNLIVKSTLPNLKKLNLLVGDGEYGGDVNASDIEAFLATTNFTNLINLGICNIGNDEFGDVLKVIMKSKYAEQIKVLDLSKSVSTDEEGEYLLANLHRLKNIRYIDLHYNYFTDEMVKKLEDCPIEINVKDSQEFDEDDGYMYYSPMYTE